MKKLIALISILIVFAVCIIGCGCNNSDIEVSLDIQYELTDDGSGYKVVGISSNVENTPLSEIVIPATYEGLDVVEIESLRNAGSFLSKVTLPETIKVIRKEAFLNCQNLTSVNIPSSVASIEAGAFKNCSELASISLPSGITVISDETFSGCLSLDEISISSKIVEIGVYAFAETGLKEALIPDTVLSLGEGIFYNCTSLVQATLPSHLDYIPSLTFAKCRQLKSVSYNFDKVTKLENAAFLGCSILKDLNLENITKIEKDALLGCTLMTEKIDGIYYSQNWIVNIDNDQVIDRVVIRENVKGIADGALNGGLMTELVISDGVMLIGDEALASLPNLKSIEIGKGLKEIGTSFLYNCTSLEEIRVNEENTFFKSVDNCLYTYDQKTLIRYNTGSTQESFTLPNGVETIEKYAFAYAGLKEIILPSGLLSILAGSFESCASLNKIDLPNTLTKLDEKSFYNCTSLESLTIPSGVTEISHSLLVGCTGLKNVAINGEITKINSFAFEGCVLLESIVIPQSTEYIGTGAFRECTSLKSVTIPKNVSEIDEFAFMNTKLTEIIVDEASESYTSVDGVLYTKDMVSLVQYPAGKLSGSFAMPSTVKVICGGAFAGNDSLTSIVLSSNTEKIGSKAFSYCTGIREIAIPSQTYEVGANAFEYSGLERISVERDEPDYENSGWSPYWSLYTNAEIIWSK